MAFAKKSEASRAHDNGHLYHDYVNPQWVKLLDVLEMNVTYTRCEGASLLTSDGRTVWDFLSGYCVHNIGHNHPRVIAALKGELNACGPAMLQSHVSDLAGEMAARLCALAGGRLAKVFFCSSGSEGVEAVIKFARAHTRRAGLLYAAGGFHGLTCGAMSLMSAPFWTQGFGPFIPGTEAVPFDSAEELEKKLATKKYAAFITEPVQSESGVIVPSPGYLRDAQALCRRYGTLFVLDEVQTGMYRSGPFLAAHHYGVEPDMVVMAKALSGGLIPSGAVLMSEAVCDSIYSSLRRAIIHTSTYSENSLAMRAGLATLDVLQDEGLGERARIMGVALRQQLAQRLAGYEMVAEVRGLGMLSGVAFRAPKTLRLRVLFEAFSRIHPAMFGQVLVRRLYKKGLLTQICGNNFMVLKVAPPLMVEDGVVEKFITDLVEVVDLMHAKASYWTEALGIARRALSAI